MNARRWAGHSGIIIQVFLVTMGVSIFGASLYGTILTSKSGMSAAEVFWFVVMWIFVVGVCGALAWTFWYMMPRTVLMDDRGVTLRRQGRSRFIGWGDVGSVSYFPPGLYQSPHIIIYPKDEYYTRKGEVVPGVFQQEVDWGIPQMGFSSAQIQEMIDSLRYFAWRAGRPPASDGLVDEHMPLLRPALPGRLDVFGDK